jgi:hypothetical protein
MFSAIAFDLPRFFLKNNKSCRSIVSINMAQSANDVTVKAIKDNQVMVFSKSYCPFCSKAKSALTELNVKFGVLELDVSFK